ncbi:MAG TPA: LamG domain-containing protein [Candidatus Limnocylindrales bacterium]|nr:LamG domain-containing protein [Candidatus Limnocylindrales bacterium]
MSRRLDVLLLPALLFAGQLTVVVLGQEPARAACAATAKDGVIAAAMAKTCGTRVEVESARSEFTRTFAEPSGLKTQEISAVPQRAKRRDGTWGAIDTTLQRAGIYLVPAAAADVRFSTGGDGPFATLTHQGHSFSLSWPRTLPAPTVEGNTATYAEVLPDVDLVVKATDSGLSHVLVVKSKRAAANPLVRQARYRVGGDGVLVSTSDGGLAVRSGDKTVATAGAAQMWDTPGHPSDKLLAMTGASLEPRKYSRVVTHVAGKDLVITPDAAMLDDPAARFPLIVDPLWNPGQSQWTYATSNNTNAPLIDETISSGDPFPAAPILRSGNDTVGRVNRSFMRFDIGGVAFKQIVDANISGRVDHTWKCSSPRPNYFYRTAGIGATPRQAWPGPQLEVLLGNNNVYANEASCSNPNMPFEVFSGTLINDLQAFANGGNSFYYVGICACSDGGDTGEWDQERWMRYFLNDFRLNIGYNSKPNVPDNLTVDGQACVAGANRPVIKTTTPTLRAHVTDPDGDSLNAGFIWAKWNGGSFVDEPGGGQQSNVPSGGTALYNATGNVDGGIYTFRAQSWDGRIASDVTHLPGNCEWQVDMVPPAVPTVAGDVYLEGPNGCPGGACGSVGRTGRFTFSSSLDTQSFLWGWSDPPTVPVNAQNGTASLDWTPTSSGPRTLYVRAVDRAGWEATKLYQFYVAAESTALARWKLDEAEGSSGFADDTGNGHAAGLGGATLGGAGRIAPGNDGVSRSAAFFGVGSAAATTAGTLLTDTSKSFSIVAWVKLTDSTASRSALSQGGAFWLEYKNSKWQFNVPGASPAVSASTARSNVWTHLAATYDSAAKRLQLFVNGSLESTVNGVTAVEGDGVFEIGDTWAGSLAEIQVWDRVISAGEVFGLYDPIANALVAKWDMSDVGPGPTYDASNLVHDLEFYPQPGGPQIPPAGAGHTGTGLSLDGFDDYARTNEPVLHTDQSFTVSAWVRLGSATGHDIILSQDSDGTNAGFFLYYQNDNGGEWIFGIRDSKTAGSATSATAPALSPTAWHQVTGVFDAQRRQIQLFVDGQLKSTVAMNAAWQPWQAVGPLQIGRALNGGVGVYTSYFHGDIDEVRIYQGVATPNNPTVIIDNVDVHASMAVNGGFNLGFASWQAMPQTNFVTYGGGVTGNDPYEGSQFAATNTSQVGGGIYQDIPVAINPGDTFCGSAHVASQGLGNASGAFAMWALDGPGGSEASTYYFTNLPGGNAWTPVHACVTATQPHVGIRVQFYPIANSPTLIIDNVDVHRSLAINGGFNLGSGSWQIMAQTNFVTYGSGVTGNDPYEGSRFAATNTSQVGGGVFQDIPVAINPGDTFCGSAHVASQGLGNASGTFTMWALDGPGGSEQSNKPFADLPGGNAWTPVHACVTATRPHSGIRVQFYPVANSPTLIIDNVDVHRSMAINGGFNHGLGSWQTMPQTGYATYPSDVTGNNPYEGSQFAATNTSQVGGGIYQDMPVTINPGDTFCASAHVASQGRLGSGAGGTFTIWALDGPGGSEQSNKPFTNLPGGNTWTPVHTCVTATRTHPGIRIQFYPTPSSL